MLVFRRFWALFFALPFAVAISGSAALANNIANVSTGLNSSYNLITTAGTPDAHWTYNDGGVIAPAQILTPAGGCSNSTNNWYCDWLPNQSGSSWIGKSDSAYVNGSDDYSFSTTFNLTGYNLSTVALSGWFTADDAGALYLNGDPIASTAKCAFQATCSSWDMMNFFSIPNADFVKGLNTLTITLTYNDDNWEGVQLSGEVTGSPTSSATPEPGTLLLLGSGLVGIGFIGRKLVVCG
jgi:hypothetical protein